jgi:hypothetical protein
MGADACIVYYGIRFDIPYDQIEAVEKRTHPTLTAARNAGLNHYWGNFPALEGEDQYFLFVGAQLALLGPENKMEWKIHPQDFQSIVEATNLKIKAAGFSGPVLLYTQWLLDQ